MLTHKVSYNPHIHIALNLISLVNALLVGEKQTPYTKTLVENEDLSFALPKPQPAQMQAMSEKLHALLGRAPSDGPILLVNPNASELLPHRRWMPDRYAELIRRVLAHDDRCAVIITGSPAESVEAAKLAQQAGPRCFSMAGKTALAELPMLYAHATAMVTNDSGPSHFAAAAGLPTIVLFGPETPNLYQPLGTSKAIYAGLACSPCVSAANHRKTACDNNVCMQAIGVEQVYREVIAALEHGASGLDGGDISGDISLPSQGRGSVSRPANSAFGN
jgi:ADP-heptose:LPS heptosyltransferase